MWQVILGERMRQFRLEKQWTEEELAGMVNISLNMFRRYEAGESKMSVPILFRIADIFDTSFDYLVGLVDDPAPYPRKKENANEGDASHPQKSPPAAL